MLCTVGYTVFFIPRRTLPKRTTVPRLCTHSAVCGVRIPFYSKHALPFPLELARKHEMSARRGRRRRRRRRGRRGHCAPTSEVTVRGAGDKQSVSPVFESCVSTVVVAGSIAPRLLLLLLCAPASVRALQYRLRFSVYPEMATVLLPTGLCKLNYSTTTARNISIILLGTPSPLFAAVHYYSKQSRGSVRAERQ